MSADFCAYCDCEIVGQVYFKKFCSEECYESHAVHMDSPDDEVCGECGRPTPCGCVDEQEFPWDDEIVKDQDLDQHESERQYFDSGPYDNDF